jgi:hypothetical protein
MDRNISDNSDFATVLEPTYSIARQYIKRASLNNHPKAQDQFGLMYLRGHGVEKDYQMALKWFTTASKSMEDKDCYLRGTDFFHARNVEQDHEIAIIYFQQVNERDTYPAQYYLDMIRLHSKRLLALAGFSRASFS